jgi:hypothetical protein
VIGIACGFLGPLFVWTHRRFVDLRRRHYQRIKYLDYKYDVRTALTRFLFFLFFFLGVGECYASVEQYGFWSPVSIVAMSWGVNLPPPSLSPTADTHTPLYSRSLCVRCSSRASSGHTWGCVRANGVTKCANYGLALPVLSHIFALNASDE